MGTIAGIFRETTIPVLEHVVSFTQTRHAVLAGNIANLDTPGYRARDLDREGFQAHLQAAIDERHRPPGRGATSPGAARGVSQTGRTLRNTETILRHDDANVSLEHEVAEMVKNQREHNLGLAVMVSQFRLLQTAISERV